MNAEPRRSISIGARISAGVRSVKSLFHSASRKGWPAKQATTSIRPRDEIVWEARALQDRGSVTSAWIATAFRPRPCTFSAKDWAASLPRLNCTATSAPSPASSRTDVLPMPPLPPVTSATRPSRRPTRTAPAPRVINPRGAGGQLFGSSRRIVLQARRTRTQRYTHESVRNRPDVPACPRLDGVRVPRLRRLHHGRRVGAESHGDPRRRSIIGSRRGRHLSLAHAHVSGPRILDGRRRRSELPRIPSQPGPWETILGRISPDRRWRPSPARAEPAPREPGRRPFLRNRRSAPNARWNRVRLP